MVSADTRAALGRIRALAHEASVAAAQLSRARATLDDALLDAANAGARCHQMARALLSAATVRLDAQSLARKAATVRKRLSRARHRVTVGHEFRSPDPRTPISADSPSMEKEITMPQIIKKVRRETVEEWEEAVEADEQPAALAGIDDDDDESDESDESDDDDVPEPGSPHARAQAMHDLREGGAKPTRAIIPRRR